MPKAHVKGVRLGPRVSPSGWLEVQPEREADLPRRRGPDVVVGRRIPTVRRARQQEIVEPWHAWVVLKIQRRVQIGVLHHVEDVVDLQLDAHLRARAHLRYRETAREGHVPVPPARMPENAARYVAEIPHRRADR